MSQAWEARHLHVIWVAGSREAPTRSVETPISPVVSDRYEQLFLTRTAGVLE